MAKVDEDEHERDEREQDDGEGSGDGSSGSGEADTEAEAVGSPDEDSGDEDEDGLESEDEEGARPSMSAKEMTRAAMELLQDLTGHEPEAATGLMWDGESWLVTVDVLELSRIPNTTDLLATYVVQLDGDGNLSGYKRTRRFQRSQAEEG
jgi:Gas vesicle synthesis protein GvpO